MYNLVAALQLQAPSNAQARATVNQINRQLQGVVVNVQLNANSRQIQQTASGIQNISTQSKAATGNVNSLGKAFGTATRRFGSVAVITGLFLSLVRGIRDATKEAIDFEREVVRISQVTGKTTGQLSGLVKEVTRLATSLGVSSKDILNTSRVLAQAGFSATQTTRALKILAQTTLAPTFDNIADTTEGAIALLNQFKNEAAATGGEIAFLEKSLGAINQVSKQFAVESSDLITVIRKTGGVFEASGGKLNELLALFTSVRATTRESADTIATGFRTIFTRIQRSDTIDALKGLGIELQDVEGKFVGPLEAIKRLSAGLSGLDPRDVRFNQIVEQLGGFRQIGKVIPLIKQFQVSTEALAAAQEGETSIAEDAAKAQGALAVQIQKVGQEFRALFRSIADSEGFKDMVNLSLQLARALIKVGESLIPLLPLLTVFAGIRLGKSFAGFSSGLLGKNKGGPIPFATGGTVPGTGNRDTVPAMLTPGEFVIRKSSVESIGRDNLAQMNAGGNVSRFEFGGRVTDGKLEAASLQDLETYKGGTEYKSQSLANQGRVDNAIKSKRSNIKGNETPGEITGIQLRKRFGISFLEGGLSGPIQSTINSVLSNSNATGSANLRGVIKGRPIRKGAKLETPNAAPAFLSNNGREIFQEEIEGGLVPLFDKATKRFSGELNPGTVTLEELISKSAIESIKGQFFEGFVRRVSGNVIQDEGKADPIFDFKNSKNKEDLLKLFDGTFIEPNEFKNNPSGDAIPSAIGKAFAERGSSKALVNVSGEPKKFAKGGSPEDTVPALLTPGEFVFNKKAADRIGRNNLENMNKNGVAGFNRGGSVARFGPGGGVTAEARNEIATGAFDEVDLNNFFSNFEAELDECTQSLERLTKTADGQTTTVNKVKRSQEKLKAKNLEQANALSASNEKTFAAAQNAIFLAGSISAVVSQFGFLSKSQEVSVGTTITQFTIFVGIIGTAGQALNAFAAKLAASGNTTVAGLGTKLLGLLGPIALVATGFALISSVMSGLEAAAKAASDKLIEVGSRELSNLRGGEDFDVNAINFRNKEILSKVRVSEDKAFKQGLSEEDRRRLNTIENDLVSLGDNSDPRIAERLSKERGEIRGNFPKKLENIENAFNGLVAGIQAASESFDAMIKSSDEWSDTVRDFSSSDESFSSGHDNFNAALEESNARLQEQRDSLKVFKDTLKNAGDEASSGIIENINATEETIDKLEEGLRSGAGNVLSAFKDRIAGRILQTGEEDVTIPDGFLEKFTGPLGTTLEELKAEFDLVKKTAHAQRDAQQQLINASLRLAASLNALADIDRLVKSTVESTQNVLKARSGGVAPSELSFEGFSNVGDLASFNSEVELITRGLGTFGAELKNRSQETAESLKGLDDSFFDAISQAGRANISEVIADELKDAPQSFIDSVTKQVVGAIDVTKLTEFATSNEARESFKKNMADLLGEADEALLKGFAKAKNTLVDNLIQLGDAARSSADAIDALERSGLERSQQRSSQIAQAEGRRVSLSTTNSNQNALLNQRVQSAGLNGPATVDNILAGAQARTSSAQSLGQAALNQEGTAAAATISRSKEQARQAGILTEALKGLADQSTKASNILGEIDFEKSKVQSFTQALDDFTFSTNQGRADTQRNYAALNTTLATGSIESIPDQFRPVVGQLLDQFKDVELAGGLTGSEIKGKFRAQTLENLLGRSLTDKERRNVEKSTTSDIERLTGDLRNLSAQEQAANQALITLEEEQRTRLLKEESDLQKNFYQNLTNILDRYFGQQQQAGNKSGGVPVAGMIEVQGNIGFDGKALAVLEDVGNKLEKIVGGDGDAFAGDGYPARQQSGIGLPA